MKIVPRRQQAITLLVLLPLHASWSHRRYSKRNCIDERSVEVTWLVPPMVSRRYSKSNLDSCRGNRETGSSPTNDMEKST